MERKQPKRSTRHARSSARLARRRPRQPVLVLNHELRERASERAPSSSSVIAQSALASQRRRRVRRVAPASPTETVARSSPNRQRPTGALEIDTHLSARARAPLAQPSPGVSLSKFIRPVHLRSRVVDRRARRQLQNSPARARAVARPRARSRGVRAVATAVRTHRSIASQTKFCVVRRAVHARGARGARVARRARRRARAHASQTDAFFEALFGICADLFFGEIRLVAESPDGPGRARATSRAPTASTTDVAVTSRRPRYRSRSNRRLGRAHRPGRGVDARRRRRRIASPAVESRERGPVSPRARARTRERVATRDVMRASLLERCERVNADARSARPPRRRARLAPLASARSRDATPVAAIPASDASASSARVRNVKPQRASTTRAEKASARRERARARRPVPNDHVSRVQLPRSRDVQSSRARARVHRTRTNPSGASRASSDASAPALAPCPITRC